MQPRDEGRGEPLSLRLSLPQELALSCPRKRGFKEPKPCVWFLFLLKISFLTVIYVLASFLLGVGFTGGAGRQFVQVAATVAP